MGGVALLIDNVTVEFGSFRAIDALSLAVDFGEVRAVIGPNGAGKTTLLDVISGIARPKQGRVMFDDATDITSASESAIARAGVRRKFQKPSIFEGLSVRQHIAIGAQGGLRRSLSQEEPVTGWKRCLKRRPWPPCAAFGLGAGAWREAMAGDRHGAGLRIRRF